MDLPHLRIPKVSERVSRVNPERDWTTLLSVTLLALLGVVALGVSSFDTVSSEPLSAPAPSSTNASFNASSLDAIRAVFAARAAEEDKYVSGAYTFSDPSK
jgi:hypothetical protein